MSIFSIPLFFLLLYAAIKDIREREIDNWLCLAIGIYSLGIKLFAEKNAGESLIYACVVFFVTTAGFVLNALGGGDVKLLTAIAIFWGKYTLIAMLVISISTLICVLVFRLLNKKWINSMPVAPFIFFAFITTEVIKTVGWKV